MNGQTSSLRPILVGDPQSSILGLLLFLICSNDLPKGLKSNLELLADDTSQFTTVKDKDETVNTLKIDLSLIS